MNTLIEILCLNLTSKFRARMCTVSRAANTIATRVSGYLNPSFVKYTTMPKRNLHCKLGRGTVTICYHLLVRLKIQKLLRPGFLVGCKDPDVIALSNLWYDYYLYDEVCYGLYYESIIQNRLSYESTLRAIHVSVRVVTTTFHGLIMLMRDEYVPREYLEGASDEACELINHCYRTSKRHTSDRVKFDLSNDWFSFRFHLHGTGDCIIRAT